MGGQRHAPATLTPGKRPGAHCTEGWVGLGGWYERVRKISEFETWTVRPLASPYTDYAIMAAILSVVTG
jgi:hypothetical protein